MTGINGIGIFTAATRPNVAWEVLWLYLGSSAAEEQPNSDKPKGKAPEAASRPFFQYVQSLKFLLGIQLDFVP